MDNGLLPPGQRVVAGFPRFGTDMGRPAPAVPDHPVIEIDGAVSHPFAVPVSRLASLPRTDEVADFHCVTGWSATQLHWEGVVFKDFFRLIIEPALPQGTSVSHVGFGGLDGFQSVVSLTDALDDKVLLVEHLDGQPLNGDHGAPLRLVSPDQYGYVSTKHLCRIVLHTRAARGDLPSLAAHPARPAARQAPSKRQRLERGAPPLSTGLVRTSGLPAKRSADQSPERQR
jgi:DMSO/TMAO reductase YedYZ molybdopterin-dependent catalytic subunit